MLTAHKKLAHWFNRDGAIAMGTHNVHCEWEKHEFSFIRNFVFLTVIKVTHIISSSKFRVDKFIRQVMIQFYGCPRAIVTQVTTDIGAR